MIVNFVCPEMKGQQCSLKSNTRCGEFDLNGVGFARCLHSSPMTGLIYEDLMWSVHLKRDATYI